MIGEPPEGVNRYDDEDGPDGPDVYRPRAQKHHNLCPCCGICPCGGADVDCQWCETEGEQ